MKQNQNLPPSDKPQTELSKAKSFTGTLLRVQNSATYGLFCEKVYGRDLRQFNSLDEEQLQKLLSSLRLNNSHSVLDLGCGGGFISEYISDVTGAKITGSILRMKSFSRQKTELKTKEIGCIF